MKSRRLAVVLLTFLNLGCPLRAASEYQAPEEFYVKNLKVILKQNPANEIISVQLYLKGGVLNLTEANQGIEPFIFNSVTLKDKKYAEKSWGKIIEGTGAELGAASEKNFTVVSLRCTRQYFDQLWEVFSDYVMKTTFYDERVEVARERMLMQIRQRKDSPDVYIRDMAEEQFYRGHPYQLNPQGVEDSIRKITIKQMTSYLKKNLKKSKLLLVVVGNVDKESLRKKVSKTFGKLSKGKYQPTFPANVTHTLPNVKVVARDLPTNYILGLFSVPNPNDPDYYPMTIAMDILKWRLFEEIRTKRNLSYAPDAFLSKNFSGSAGIYATSTEPDSTVKIMLIELKKLQKERVAEKDLQDRINMYLTQYYLNNESNTAQAQFLAYFELSGLGWQESERIVEKLRNISSEDVQRVASQYFRNIQFVVLGNPDLIDKKLLTSM
ncbi:MAG: M16 family metallopeptidase [bacterium]